MKSTTIASLIAGAALVIVVAALVLPSTRHNSPSNPSPGNESADTTTMAEPDQAGTGQVLGIVVKGGYTPTVARAKAGVPLTLKLKTSGTFDCSTGVRIPSLGWSQTLNPTDEISVPVPAQKAGTTLVGVCTMGMYNFKIAFE